MPTVAFAALLLAGLLSISCSRSHTSSSHTEERSVEQRVADLEQHLDPKAQRFNEAEARKQYEHDYAEIQSMGLVERAQRDFSDRLTNATVETWTIGYFMHTNTVWCDVRYRLSGGGETLQQEFGYARKTGTNWSLIWGVGGQPQ